MADDAAHRFDGLAPTIFLVVPEVRGPFTLEQAEGHRTDWLRDCPAGSYISIAEMRLLLPKLVSVAGEARGYAWAGGCLPDAV